MSALRIHRDTGPHGRPWGTGGDFQFASELTQPLVHAPDANPQQSKRIAFRFGHAGWHAFALILNFEDSFTILDGEPDVRRLAFRMPVNVRQTFLKNAKERKFGVF